MSDDSVDVPEAAEEEVTIWAPEPTGNDDVLAESVKDWISSVNFETTEDVPIPENLVDQVIGQEAGSIVIRLSLIHI